MRRIPSVRGATPDLAPSKARRERVGSGATLLRALPLVLLACTTLRYWCMPTAPLPLIAKRRSSAQGPGRARANGGSLWASEQLATVGGGLEDEEGDENQPGADDEAVEVRVYSCGAPSQRTPEAPGAGLTSVTLLNSTTRETAAGLLDTMREDVPGCFMNWTSRASWRGSMQPLHGLQVATYNASRCSQGLCAPPLPARC
jgi:hypothetical protein